MEEILLGREAYADKVFVLGIDALEPRLTKKYIDMGIMPNVKKLLELGSAREDLMLLGGHPTVTPPMWTTLATGCYANVHGITGYWRQSKKDLDYVEYNIDSRLCAAEQVWNITAEAGKKTLVWHWPGGSWPPTSDSENLYVVDGSAPGVVGLAAGMLEGEFLVRGNVRLEAPLYVPHGATESSMPCVMDEEDLPQGDARSMEDAKTKEKRKIIIRDTQLTGSTTDHPLDMCQTPIKDAQGWANAPEGAKEFTVLASGGFIRRLGLLLKNEEGIYDSFALYKSKKDAEPMFTAKLNEMVINIVDDVIRKDEKMLGVRSYKMIKCAPDGSDFSIWVSSAMKEDASALFHPQSIYRKVVENCGYLPPMSMAGSQDDVFILELIAGTWKRSAEWQSASINYLIEEEGIETIFSHFHSVDLFDHLIIKHLAGHPNTKVPYDMVENWMQANYKIADYYVGEFLHLLDKGWTIMLVSDHGQVASKYPQPILGDTDGVNVTVMRELGFTELLKDENGNDIEAIDWTKTKAVATRECNIYLNLKGRNKHELADGTIIDGIVDPADKYEVEEEIMTALYGYRHPISGHRIVSVALRNKDAVLLGYGGSECGDICYWLAEGYNFDHADCLSTSYGESDTSVSPIFIAAGKGIKAGHTTERMIRQIDVAPMVSTLLGLRMPAQCEGAPIYQILDSEF